MATILVRSVLVALVLVCDAVAVCAQMDMQHEPGMSARPLGIPDERTGSGTSWVPDASPMHAAHMLLGSWTAMVHGDGWLYSDWQGGPRGADQLGLVNWAMLAASRSLGGGRLEFRGMWSAEPWTIGGRGYPLLLQSGESYQGAPLHDRQHPHDLFMELAAVYERPVARTIALALYLAPVGEPAVGPAAYPHRPSAAADPLAPISHHWQDGTHITFGVVTAGAFTRTVKLETSWFNGREPDERRTNFDYPGRRLDSYAARVSVNPGPRWSLSAWYAYLESPEALHPDESLHRFGAALLTTQRVRIGTWSSALISGANAPIGTRRVLASVLLESEIDLDGGTSFFGRVEYVRKTAEDLVIPSAIGATTYDVAAAALGVFRTLGTVGPGLESGVGARGSVNFVPSTLAAIYGSRTPVGLTVYARLRPAASRQSAMHMTHD